MGGVLILLTVMELVSMFWYWDIEEAGIRHRGNVGQADFSRWSRNTGAYIQLHVAPALLGLRGLYATESLSVICPTELLLKWTMDNNKVSHRCSHDWESC